MENTRKKQQLGIWLAVLLLVAAAICAVLLLRGQGKPQAGEVKLKNPEFNAGGVGGAPLSWEIKSYEDQFTVRTEGGVVTLGSEVADDLRVLQKVSVASNTKYVLTCEVKTDGVSGGRGAGLSVDNMDIDKSCIYSEPVSGTSDWKRVELAFITMNKQTQVLLALRLGGYGEASAGRASFRNIAFEQTNVADVPFQQLMPWGDGSSGGGGEAKEKDEFYYKEVFSIILLASIIAAIVLLVGFYSNLKRIGAYELTKKKSNHGILAIIAAGVLLRFVLTWVFGGHETDMSCWIAWGGMVAGGGPASVYRGFCDYPPGYMAVVGLISGLQSLLGIGARTPLGLFGYMIPPMLADFGCAWLIVRIGRKQNLPEGIVLLLAGLVALNPAAVFLSGAWGQIDSVLTLFLLLSFYSLSNNKRLLSGIFFGLAVLFKWQALMFGPVLAAAFILSVKDSRDLRDTVLAVLAALLTIFLVSLPFRGEQGLFWIVERFDNAFGGYKFASIEAYNFIALIGGNWKPTSGTSFVLFGWVAIVLAIILSILMLADAWWRNRKNETDLFAEPGALYLAAAFCLFAIFTFGHYMHERYVFPVIFLLLGAYAYYRDKRILLAAIFVTITTFANSMTAMYIVSKPAMDFIRGGREHNDLLRAVSLAQVLSFGYFVWVCGDRILGWGKKTGGVFARLADKINTRVKEWLSDGK